MVDDNDYLALARGLMLLITDLQVEMGTLRLAVQKHGISATELENCKQEIRRRCNADQLEKEIRALNLESVLARLSTATDTVQ